VRAEGDDEEDEEPEESEEELDENGDPIPKPKIYDENEIMRRVNDEPSNLNKELAYYCDNERPAYDEILKMLHNH
jgi:hypothetical protein